MAIDRIYIPTYQRVDHQLTYDLLPQYYKSITDLVVTEKESHEHIARGRNVLVCPAQGKGIAGVRNWLMKTTPHTKWLMIDDDVTNFQTRMTLQNSQLIDIERDNDILHTKIFEHIDRQLEDWARVSIPSYRWSNHTLFFDPSVVYQGTLFAFNYDLISRRLIDETDWAYVEQAEDCWINIVFLAHGVPCFHSPMYRLKAEMDTPGGLRELRQTGKYPPHECYQKIVAAYPDILQMNNRNIYNHQEGAEWRHEIDNGAKQPKRTQTYVEQRQHMPVQKKPKLRYKDGKWESG